MLVLSRREGEAVVTENGVRVEIVRLRGNQVQIGVSAPDDVGIWREELATAAGGQCKVRGAKCKRR